MSKIDEIVDQEGWTNTKKHILSHAGYHLMKFMISDYLNGYKGYLQRIDDAIRNKSLNQINQTCMSFERILIYYTPPDSELSQCIVRLRSRTLINLELVHNFRELENYCEIIDNELKFDLKLKK